MIILSRAERDVLAKLEISWQRRIYTFRHALVSGGICLSVD